MIGAILAKKYLQTELQLNIKAMPEDLKNAMEIAISAVDKQIKKKPTLSGSGHFHVCPNCKKLIEKNERSHGRIDIPYCKWCGQLLDWESE